MIHFITLGFAPHRILKEGLKRFYSTSLENPSDYRHYYLNQHYPIDSDVNNIECIEECKKYNITCFDTGKNLGLHGGFNYVIDKINPDPSDVVVAYDPDFYPLANGWDSALIDVVSEPGIGWATLCNPQSEREMKERGHDEVEIKGHRVWLTHQAVTNITCAWKASVLRLIGGITENRPVYGHLEAPMFHKMQALGLKWAFVHGFPDSDELRKLHDKEYSAWKWVHAHDQTWDGDFKSWLEAGMPNPLAPLSPPKGYV